MSPCPLCLLVISFSLYSFCFTSFRGERNLFLTIIPTMSHCQRCLEDNWSIGKMIDGFITITCKNCGYEFLVEKNKPLTKVLKEGDPCRHCNTPVVLIKNKKLTTKKLRGKHHYCRWLKCPKCRTVFFLNEWKRYPDQPCDCEREKSKDLPQVKILFDCLRH